MMRLRFFNSTGTVSAVLLILFLCLQIAHGQGRNLGADHRFHEKFPTKFKVIVRDLIVWLPPGYLNETQRRYPVLYMHDGDSAFVNWRLDETALTLIQNNEIDPIIIVYVPNGGSHEARYDEYTPSRDSRASRGGNADQYGRMLVEEIKPFIDSQYRTLNGPEHTGLGGASLGGLVTMYLGLKYPGTFGRLAVLSPSVWWDNGVILKEVKGLQSKPEVRVWLDVGTQEETGRDKVTQRLRDELVKKGWVLNEDLIYYEAKGHRHEESDFAKRAPLFLKYLFPKTKEK